GWLKECEDALVNDISNLECELRQLQTLESESIRRLELGENQGQSLFELRSVALVDVSDGSAVTGLDREPPCSGEGPKDEGDAPPLQTRIISADQVRREPDKWRGPITEEYESLVKKTEAVEELTEAQYQALLEDPEVAVELIPGKLVYVHKTSGRRKARIVGCGNYCVQSGSGPRSELYASGAGAESLRMTVRRAALDPTWSLASVDVKTAFLQAPLLDLQRGGKQLITIVRAIPGTESVPAVKAYEVPEPTGDTDLLSTTRKAQAVIGQVLWLSNRTRPDLAYAVNMAAQKIVANPLEALARAEHIIRYIRHSPGVGLHYKPARLGCGRWDQLKYEEHPASIDAFSDASFAADEQCRSFGSIQLFWAGAMIAWSANRQTLIASHTAECELYSLAEAHLLGKALRPTIASLMDVSEREIESRLYCDNAAAIQLCVLESGSNPVPVESKKTVVKVSCAEDGVQTEDSSFRDGLEPGEHGDPFPVQSEGNAPALDDSRALQMVYDMIYQEQLRIHELSDRAVQLRTIGGLSMRGGDVPEDFLQRVAVPTVYVDDPVPLGRAPDQDDNDSVVSSETEEEHSSVGEWSTDSGDSDGSWELFLLLGLEISDSASLDTATPRQGGSRSE
ncbi:RE1, partial [Symbiodinium necroappetens]